MNAKIISVTSTGSFPFKQGPNAGKTGFGQRVEMSDGQFINACSMTEQPPYQAGDEVVYEITGADNRGNPKGKIKKADSKFAGAIKPGATNTQATHQIASNGQQSTQEVPSSSSIHPATAGCAFKAAIEVLTPLGLAENAKNVWILASSYVRVLQSLEHGKLAPKVGEALPETTKATLAASGFTAPMPVQSNPQPGPHGGVAFDPNGEDVPF